MKRFVDLYDALDATTSTRAKVAALVEYFRATPPGDAVWALYFLTGRRLKRLLPTKLLVAWALELAHQPDWMFAECYGAVGDLAETIALLIASRSGQPCGELSLSQWMDSRILPLRQAAPEEQRERVQRWWRELPRRELFILNKLLTGEYRVGVSRTLVVRALAELAGLPAPTIAHRLMGDWSPSAPFFEAVLARGDEADGGSRPYPFFLATPLEGAPEALGAITEWLVEWKWDGIRGQLLRRQGATYLWSRGEELLTERFPELLPAAAGLPDGTVLDGEVLAFAGDRPLPFSALQTRIGRQRLTGKALAEAPVAFIAFDLLEDGGRDIRAQPLAERRARLEALLAEAAPPFAVSERISASSWAELGRVRGSARERRVEGMMLKRLSSAYGAGRRRGDWWKWKIDPFTVDAVLVYAQPGNGKRANLLTDYTFAVWSGDELVPVAKAYSGLTDEEIAEVDRWIRGHTVQRFGPVRAVEPSLVFELHFEAIAPSKRHRSGVAVRFPRIARWRKDKPARDADTLTSLEALLNARPAAPQGR